jgi:hypothetical protein
MEQSLIEAKNSPILPRINEEGPGLLNRGPLAGRCIPEPLFDKDNLGPLAA